MKDNNNIKDKLKDHMKLFDNELTMLNKEIKKIDTINDELEGVKQSLKNFEARGNAHYYNEVLKNIATFTSHKQSIVKDLISMKEKAINHILKNTESQSANFLDPKKIMELISAEKTREKEIKSDEPEDLETIDNDIEVLLESEKSDNGEINV